MTKESNKSLQIQITLTDYHKRKLNLIEKHTGLTKSGIIQRLIENYKIPGRDETEE